MTLYQVESRGSVAGSPMVTILVTGDYDDVTTMIYSVRQDFLGCSICLTAWEESRPARRATLASFRDDVTENWILR